jgi:hypothetical protein
MRRPEFKDFCTEHTEDILNDYVRALEKYIDALEEFIDDTRRSSRESDKR